MARALVLGGTGHIGSHVVRALLTEGHAVCATYRNPRYLNVLEGLDLRRVKVDLESLEGLDQALEGCEWVFHAAGYYPAYGEDKARAVDKGIFSVRRLFQALLKARPRRVVFTSSASTIRRIPGRPANETDAEPWPPLKRRSLYATVKIAMEHEALSLVREGLPVVVVNPSLCLGEYDSRPFSGRAILAFARFPLPVYVDYRLNAIYTGDVGVGHVRAAEAGRVGQRYLLAHHNLTMRELASLVAEETGTAAPRWRLPHPVVWAIAAGSELLAWITRKGPFLTLDEVFSGRMGQWLDGSKAREELGLPQTPLKEAIRRAVAWFKQMGYLGGVPHRAA